MKRGWKIFKFSALSSYFRANIDFMVRNFLNEAVQKKFFLMFFTCVIYIIGLFAYFFDKGVLFASIILLVGLFAIIKDYISPKLVLFWYFMFFFAFFNASLRIKNSDVLYQLAPQNATIQGQVVSIAQSDGNGKIKFFFDTSKIKFDGTTKNIKAKTYVSMYSKGDDSSKINIGDSYTIEGKLRTPFKVSNPSQFDYGRYLRNYGVFTLFYATEKGCSFQSGPDSLKWKFLQGLNNVRNDIIQTHSKYLKSPNLEILGGIVFGDDAVAPPQDIKKAFINSGLLHILAASGMNVALIYGIWFFILRKLRVPFNIAVSSGIFVIIFYSFMTGLGPSVIRAAFMLIFILVGKLIDRDAHSISLLAFVALLMLIYNPAYINDVGFELSFLVTFGLLIMAPIIFEKVKFIPGWLSGAVLVPIIAQIWVAPIQMYYFNSFSLYSVFANIVILPFVTVISFGGFISAVLSLVKPLANAVCFIFDFFLTPFLNALVFISNFFAKLPHSLIQVPEPSLVQMCLYYSIVLLVALLLKTWGKYNKQIISAICILVLFLSFTFIHFPDSSLDTLAFDVQNADAFLIKTPHDKYFLIDSGKMAYSGGKTQAQMVILQYLKDKGIKNIQGFIITHFDSDHAGGAVDLIENLNIKNVYVNSLNDKSHLAKKIYRTAKNKTNLVLAKNNEVIYREDKLSIKTFLAGLKSEENENENSVITLVSDNSFEELFMGDAGVVAFDKIKKHLPKNIEVLKVGHHGAKNVVDKKFLDAINPQIAIISTGPNNYGHPNGITLDVLERHKVKVLRTDRQNAIEISEQNNFYKVYSCENGRFVLKMM